MVTFCKARTVARGEKIFHAPRDAEGYFECTEKRDEDGILKEVVFRIVQANPHQLMPVNLLAGVVTNVYYILQHITTYGNIL